MGQTAARRPSRVQYPRPGCRPVLADAHLVQRAWKVPGAGVWSAVADALCRGPPAARRRYLRGACAHGTAGARFASLIDSTLLQAAAACAHQALWRRRSASCRARCQPFVHAASRSCTRPAARAFSQRLAHLQSCSRARVRRRSCSTSRRSALSLSTAATSNSASSWHGASSRRCRTCHSCHRWTLRDHACVDEPWGDGSVAGGMSAVIDGAGATWFATRIPGLGDGAVAASSDWVALGRAAALDIRLAARLPVERVWKAVRVCPAPAARRLHPLHPRCEQHRLQLHRALLPVVDAGSRRQRCARCRHRFVLRRARLQWLPVPGDGSGRGQPFHAGHDTARLRAARGRARPVATAR
jgi:hypothetical protein